MPRSGTWLNHPQVLELFEQLALDKHVDATIERPPSRNYWQLPFVDLKRCSDGLVNMKSFSLLQIILLCFFSFQNIRDVLIQRALMREVPNEKIYQELNYLIKPVDMVIYSIRHEGDDYDDDDDD